MTDIAGNGVVRSNASSRYPNKEPRGTVQHRRGLQLMGLPWAAAVGVAATPTDRMDLRERAQLYALRAFLSRSHACTDLECSFVVSSLLEH